MNEQESLFNLPKRQSFFLLCAATLTVLFIKKTMIENETAAFEFLADQPQGSMLYLRSVLQYLSIPLIYAWKFTALGFVIWVGCFLFGYRVTYNQCWTIVLIAEFVFLIPEIIKIIWFLVFDTDPNYYEIRAFYPLSVMNFVDFENLGARYAYPFKALNLFELLYWLVLALGIAASIETVRRVVGRRPQLALAGLALPLVVWNGALALQVRRGLVPRDDTVEGPRLVGQAAGLVSEAVGFPTTWPASWVFAWRTGLSPGQYDRLVGRYLFYRFNNRKGRIEIGAEDDEPMLGEGWSRAVMSENTRYRTTQGPARVLCPLDVPEELEVKVRATAEGDEVAVALRVNGTEAGRFLAGTEWAEHRVRVPSGFWRRELNDVVLAPESGRLRVSLIELAQLAEKR